ncbi:hypothetical protein D187_007389 [Cystobacter fuscus DSM 2262]|uniref:Uncharacterized protein n=1 Tax=Cystobacter fuscus (strain ATCC 25194 / DSM 2262 / NBRC 100088 / M29) TaxID=1242864 RepID=S9P1A2_CYSF2|nr:hypothetical protein [Cystobacter fuscus]EPX56047.1 hypothetical protein D187_007389 [Cystobacter fuscus DSM 2262]
MRLESLPSLHRPSGLYLLLAAVLWLACLPGGGTPPTVTSVRVVAEPTRIAPDGTARLVAVVDGTGSFDPGVSWTLERGLGELSSLEGSEVTYKAPPAVGEPEVVIRATSRVDPTQSATVALTVSAGTVSRVMISATPTTLAPEKSMLLVAFVAGQELEERRVTWRLLEGPGRLSQSLDGSATYLVEATATGVAVVEATSRADPSHSGTLTLTNSPPATDLIHTVLETPRCVVERGRAQCQGQPAAYGLPVRARISSTHEVVRVLARIPGTDRQTPLTFDFDKGVFTGTLDLRSLSQGHPPLEVEVTDSRGNTLVTPSTFVIDHPPELEVLEPTGWSTVLSAFPRIRATCRDQEGACTLSVGHEQMPGTILVTGGETIDTTVDLSPFVGKNIQLTLQAKDSLGQQRSRSFSVFVSDNPSLELVARVPGLIAQVDATRILYTTARAPTDRATGLVLRDRASGLDSQLPVPQGTSVSGAQLIPTGVVFGTVTATESVYPRLYAYQQGVLVSFADRVHEWKIRGDHVLWSTPYPEVNLMLRQLSTQSTVRVAQAAGRFGMSLTETGFVAFADEGYDIHTYQDGVTRRLTNEPNEVVLNSSPLTDGTLVVYRKYRPNKTQWLALHAGDQELSLTQPYATSGPEFDFALHAGWVAYTNLGNTGQAQVWLRNPGGDTRQVSDFGTSSNIEALVLGPEGQLAIQNNFHLWVSRAEGPPRDAGVVRGHPMWLDGAWHVIWEDCLFRVR